MKGYKSPVSRLARLFKKSRDVWKERAIQKQKKVRELEIKVRDLNRSRERWKEKAKEAQQEVGRIKEEQKSRQREGEEKDESRVQLLSPETAEVALSAPARHHYPVYIIQLGIQQVIEGLNSLRSCERNFALFGQFFALETPSFSSVRHWLLRLGLYVLQKEAEYRSDWIIILDLTIELGQTKCLVILGIPASRLPETGYALQHQDVEVLDIAVLSHSTGVVIEQKLNKLTEQIGRPKQIVADHGSDVKKGIELYQEQNPEVIYTYDITHQMALLLKKELENDERYRSFVQHCCLSRQQTQQTELYFLASPKQRRKARYLNVDTHVHWAQQVLHYQAQEDFSEISSVFTLDSKTFSSLAQELDDKTLSQLGPMVGQEYPDKQSFTTSLGQHIEPEVLAQKGADICQAADVGRRRFHQKFGWLVEYKNDVCLYAQMVDIVHTVEKQVKQEGLNQTSKAVFEARTKERPLQPRAQRFKEQVVEYLAQEGNKIPQSQTLLGTSDIIESVFGKYKLFSSESALKEMGKMVLTIPLLTTKITSHLVKEAMETVRGTDVEDWSERVFGQSMLSKRRTVFNGLATTLKLQEKPP